MVADEAADLDVLSQLGHLEDDEVFHLLGGVLGEGLLQEGGHIPRNGLAHLGADIRGQAFEVVVLGHEVRLAIDFQ